MTYDCKLSLYAPATGRKDLDGATLSLELCLSEPPEKILYLEQI